MFSAGWMFVGVAWVVMWLFVVGSYPFMLKSWHIISSTVLLYAFMHIKVYLCKRERL